MPKTGRNDPCPCGSGKKYKRCCHAKDQAAEVDTLSAKRAELEAQRGEHRARIQSYHASLMSEADELDDASNAVVDLLNAGQLDEAERAARELLVRYPEVHDGYHRLGMVYEARGHNRQAAECYRKVVEFMREHPADFDSELPTFFLERIARLDPPAVGD